MNRNREELHDELNTESFLQQLHLQMDNSYYRVKNNTKKIENTLMSLDGRYSYIPDV